MVEFVMNQKSVANYYTTWLFACGESPMDDFK